MSEKNDQERDAHIKAATKAAFGIVMEYHKEHNISMSAPDFSLTVAARVLSIILATGQKVLGSDMTDAVLNGIREDIKEHNGKNVATH